MSIKDKITFFYAIEEKLWDERVNANKYLATLSILCVALLGAWHTAGSFLASSLNWHVEMSVFHAIMLAAYLWVLNAVESVLACKDMKTAVLRSLLILVSIALAYIAGVVLGTIDIIIVYIVLFVLFYIFMLQMLGGNMKNLHSKIATIALAILSVICFLSMDIVEGMHITGADLFRFDKDNAPLWPSLFITIPILVALIRFAIVVDGGKTKLASVINASLMFIPVMAYKADVGGESDSHVGIAIKMYIILSIAIIAIAFFTKTDDTPEDNGMNAIIIKKEDTTLKLRKQYDEAKLREIVSNPALYKASLVEACKKELAIRESASGFMEEVRNYPDDKIGQILASRDIYSDAIVFCCQKVRAERLAEQRKAEARKREEEKQRLIQEKKEKREKRDAWWKKNRKYFFLAFAALLVLLLVLYLNSDGRQYNRGVEEFDKGNYTEAISLLSKVGGGYKDATQANWLLYHAYKATGDEANAAYSLVKAAKNRNWDEHHEAYMEYAKHLIYGTMKPHIPQNEELAASLMETAHDDLYRETAGELYFKHQKWEKAYSLLSDYASKNDPDNIARRANAFMGALYLFGLGGLDADIDKANDYFDKAEYVKGFSEIMMIAKLAALSKESYPSYVKGKITQIQDIASLAEGEESRPLGKAITDAAQAFCKAAQKHTKGNYGWTYTDEGWKNYDYNENKGHYVGEYSSGGASGYGCFTGSYTRDGVNTSYYAQIGRFVRVQNECPMNGNGIIVNYTPTDGGITIYIFYGSWHMGKQDKELYWTNSSFDSYFTSTLVTEMPF